MLATRTRTIFRVRGIPVRVDTSWLLVVLLVAWSFTDRFGGDGRHRVGIAIAMGAAATVLFFGSVLAHELGHALEARHRGVSVRDITLYVFGGATATTTEPRRPVDSFALTAVGPYTSIVLGAAFGLVAAGADELGLDEVAEVAGLQAWLNLGLGVFNLLPGAPLDGGRILESAVWRVTGDRLRAKVAAARAGRVLGSLLVALGLAQAFVVDDGFFGGLWLAFIGWFLVQGATAEQAQAGLERLLRGRPASALLSGDADTVPPETSLAWTLDNVFHRHHVDAVAVAPDGADADGPTGILLLGDALAVPQEDRWRTTVADVARRLADVPAVAAGDPAVEVLRRLADAPVVAVVDGTRVQGVVTPARIDAAVQRLSVLEGAAGGRP